MRPSYLGERKSRDERRREVGGGSGEEKGNALEAKSGRVDVVTELLLRASVAEYTKAGRLAMDGYVEEGNIVPDGGGDGGEHEEDERTDAAEETRKSGRGGHGRKRWEG